MVASLASTQPSTQIPTPKLLGEQAKYELCKLLLAHVGHEYFVSTCQWCKHIAILSVQKGWSNKKYAEIFLADDSVDELNEIICATNSLICGDPELVALPLK